MRRLSATQMEQLNLLVKKEQQVNKRRHAVSNEREGLKEHLHTLLATKEEKHRQLVERMQQQKQQITIQILDKHRKLNERTLAKQRMLEDQVLMKKEYRELKMQDWYANLEDDKSRRQLRNQQILSKFQSPSRTLEGMRILLSRL